MFDILIVGAGFSGAVTARQMAEKYRKKVLILEKRPHIGVPGKRRARALLRAPYFSHQQPGGI